MTEALYGPQGFFTGPQAAGPSGHFRTSVHVSRLFARAVAALLERLDKALKHPDHLDVVDIGAGRGELLTGLLSVTEPSLASRLRPIAVELAPRPSGVPSAITWTAQLPAQITGLLIATEWLDNVPLDIAVIGDDPALRYLLVDDGGVERIGPPIAPEDTDWLERWWPLSDTGERAEIGRPRDEAWADAVSRVTRGLALAVDYGHLRQARPALGTLTGYRHGRVVPPVPDGGCDLTAHVALDAVAEAGTEVAKLPPRLLPQRQALHALGVEGSRPPLTLASQDPGGYLRRLAECGEAAELTDPDGLGGHTWLLQPVGIDDILP